MFDYFDSGFTTWDLADHYGPAEDFVGEFRRKLAESHGHDKLSEIQAFTKWVPSPGRMTRQLVKENIERSLRRMKVETLDLLQFHWWEYRDTNYLDALLHLSELRDEGRIRHLALTNFDTEHLEQIIDHEIRIVSNQVQFSVVDLRPLVRMVPFCKEHGIQLLTYGTLCGGLLAEKYLGQPEPARAELNTASLRKYKQMVDAWGGWELFQELLKILNKVADKHGVSVANIGMRYILDQPAVAGVIIGARLGISDRRADNARVFDFRLDDEDRHLIESVLGKSHDLYRLIGDCGAEYR
jgi:aryl-alcohol dehydrogenase-like predicted oxidoreductase